MDDESRGHIDIAGNLRTYLDDRRPSARYASFDYCFNHFQAYREKDRIASLAEPDNLQQSCLHLGFYLASWGMLRGSSKLLQRSARSFVPVVESIASAPAELWNIDADDYSHDACTALMEFAGVLRRALHHGASDILVTKIMLGTMGCVPAFDTYFKRGFRVATFGPKSLRKLGAFYRDNRTLVEAHREATLDFGSGLPTDRVYTRAKVIDMIFFIEGMR